MMRESVYVCVDEVNEEGSKQRGGNDKEVGDGKKE